MRDLSLAASLIAMLIGFWPASPAQTQTKPAEPAVIKLTKDYNTYVYPDGSIATSAFGLAAIYEQNWKTADSLFKDKVIIVTGLALAAPRDGGQSSLVFLSSPHASICIECDFDPQHEAELSDIRKGDKVVVQGKCIGRQGSLLLIHCRLLPIPLRVVSE